MEFSSLFFYLLFFGQIFQFSNTIVSSAKVEIPAQNAFTDKLDSFTEQMDGKDVDIGKRLVQQRIKRDTDDEPIPEDAVFIDHRDTNCLAEPRNQGRCRASYAFVTISLYEWLSCKKMGGFQAFSEQYIIDCSERHGNFGCDGGNLESALRFVNDCGLEFREDYPYTGEKGLCPHNNSFPSENMGSLRINEPSVEHIPIDQLAKHLEYGPIIVIVEISNEFVSYAGGVDDNVGHTPKLLQAMLLIGHGRENGKEYWLFRNSHFTTSGGLYKLNKNVDCFKGRSGIGLSSPFSG